MSARSTIRRVQRATGVLLAVLTVLLLANSAFLATAFTPEGLVLPMQRAHLVLGGLLAAALVAFAGSHFVLHRRHRNTGARSIGLVVATVALLGCAAGVALWMVGKSRTVGWLVILHEGAFVAALGAYVLHRRRALVTPALRPEQLAAGAAILLGGGIWAAQLWWPTHDEHDQAPRATLVPGLSQARTIDGHVLRPEDLDDPAYCAQCHPAIAERWEASVHHFGSLNDPFYAGTLALAQQHRQPDELKFCGGCHDPLLLLTGRMDEHPRPEQPGADAGITCLACHALVEAPSRLGNGSYVVAAPEHYPGYDSDDPDERERSNRLIRSKPEAHVESFGKPYLRSPEMCVGCHKAHIPPELNSHRWLRGQDEYDPWHDSGAGGNSARTFFPPAPEQKRCQDCHMPQIPADDPAAGDDGKVADHAFLGANTALPRALGDEGWVARNQAFLEGVLTVDVGAIEVEGEGPPQRRLAPEGPIPVPAGRPLTLDVVVRNTGSGHLYPGGIADLRESWLEVTVRSESGEPLLARGWLDARGNLDPEAHQWNAVLLDGEGEPLLVHDVEDTHSVLVARRIMLGASDLVRLSLSAPEQPCTVELRVLDRKLTRSYVETVLGPDAPQMPITEIASTTLSLVPGDFVIVPPATTPEVGARLRNLGIAHLLRGDTALAREAALAAAERRPDDPGPPLDLARGALDDGALERAEEHVRAADAVSPGHPTAAWLLARIRGSQGDHEAALAALDVALAAFPRDRELLAMKGDSLFRLEREEEAAAVLQSVLEIDPEHLTAHALLTRIRAEQGDEASSQRHREAWDRVRPHSDDQVFNERARRANAALDRRANLQYVVPLAPPPPGWTPARSGP
ncbi:MAG: tetratricopeptide repeat protein [Myxococcales bacterium]|nr:tetratricopeptide repeat protein [Myxococcales bacterium]